MKMKMKMKMKRLIEIEMIKNLTTALGLGGVGLLPAVLVPLLSSNDDLLRNLSRRRRERGRVSILASRR